MAQLNLDIIGITELVEYILYSWALVLKIGHCEYVYGEADWHFRPRQALEHRVCDVSGTNLLYNYSGCMTSKDGNPQQYQREIYARLDFEGLICDT